MKEKIMNVWLNEKMNSCLQRELNKKLAKWGSEIRTLPDFEWSAAVSYFSSVDVSIDRIGRLHERTGLGTSITS